jgi:chromodomain-helicase-DNA-binding protein 7
MSQVNKWLAEQSGLMNEQLTADFLARRRKPRQDPSIMDWKKVTGEENVPVVNRITGKKVCKLFNYLFYLFFNQQ